MSSILFSLPELYASYKNWLSQNPQIASDYETTAKWISYFVAGRINNSHVVSELIYALSNLLVLFNDRIINQARQIELPTSGDRLKLWLTVVEYCEVFFELSAQKVWGNAGKWLIVVAVQVFKCISRFILLYHHNEPIIPHPPIPTLERRVLVSPESSTDPSFGDVTQAHLDSVSFTLKRSGKVVRKVDSSPPITARSWKSLERSSQCDNEQTIEQTLAGTQLIAESIYIAKPIVHLASMAAFGSHTWKPWVISLLMELSSLHLHRSYAKTKLNALTKKQRLQLSRRTVMLVMYLLRSPFYDRYSKDRINALLGALGKNVPLAGVICNPIAQYLPFWQSNYFYTWST